MARARKIGKGLVGLDIEPTQIAAVQVSPGGGLHIEHAAVAPLPPGVVRDGEVTDATALAEVLKEFFRQHGFGKRVRLGVANQRIVVRALDLPPLPDEKQLDAAVRFQAQEQIPMPLEQAVLDYINMGHVQTPDGERIRVVVVAARRDMIERLLVAARAAGLRPEGIDLAAFALVRALAGPDEADGTAALYASVNGITNLAVATGRTCLFTRIVPGGIETLAGELAERRALTLEHARQWLAHVGLQAPLESVEGDSEIVSEARSVLAEGARRIADEMRNTLDFYRNQPAALPVERVVVTGPATAIAGFDAQVSHELGIPVTSATVGDGAVGALDGVDAGRLTVAAGLAVEERTA